MSSKRKEMLRGKDGMSKRKILDPSSSESQNEQDEDLVDISSSRENSPVNERKRRISKTPKTSPKKSKKISVSKKVKPEPSKKKMTPFEQMKLSTKKVSQDKQRRTGNKNVAEMDLSMSSEGEAIKSSVVRVPDSDSEIIESSINRSKSPDCGSSSRSETSDEDQSLDIRNLSRKQLDFIIKYCSENQPSISLERAIVSTKEDLQNLVQRQNLQVRQENLMTSIRQAIVSDSAKKEKQVKPLEVSSDEFDEIPEDEWEVEAIKDWIITPSGKLLFRVKWMYWTGKDTWEPRHNLENASEMVESFLSAKYPPGDEAEQREDGEKLAQLRIILEKICGSREGDIGLVIKLLEESKQGSNKEKNVIDPLDDSDSDSGSDSDDEAQKSQKKKKEVQKNPAEEDATDPGPPHDECPDPLKFMKNLPNGMTPTFNKTNREELFQVLRKRCRLILDYFTDQKLYTPKQVLGATVKCLGIEEKFGSLSQFLEYANERREFLKKLSEREDKLNKRIKDLKEGPPIQLENLYDTVLPDDFEFLCSYDRTLVDDNSDNPQEPLIYCTCEEGECGKKCPCVKENQRLPFNEQGTLLLDGRNAIYECNQRCKCGPNCRYKVASKGRIYPFCIFRTPDGRGYGLKALEAIPKKKYIVSYLGELLPVKESAKRDKTQKEQETTYMMDLDFNEQGEAEFAVDARYKGNLSRFINHSCCPNLCINPIWSDNLDIRQPLIAFFSLRNIARGEELFIDYNAVLQDMKDPEMVSAQLQQNEEVGARESIICKCGATGCRGIIF